MAIKDRMAVGREFVCGAKRLDLFTDRNDSIRLFVEFLNDDPPQEQILFFHGEGGNGKSLLLDLLFTRYCRRLHPDDWKYIRTLPDEELQLHFVECEDPLLRVPAALVNFATVQAVESRRRDLRDPFEGLLSLYRQLRQFDLPFALFPFACVRYLRQEENKSLNEIQSEFPEQEAELVCGLFDLATGVPVASIALGLVKLLRKHLGDRYEGYRERHHLGTEAFDDLCRLKPSELLDRLPRLFAEDLNEAIRTEHTPGRIILFFDTHEAFWGEQVQRISMSRAHRARRDRWLRQLLCHVELGDGIVAIVAGRNLPAWKEAPDEFPIPDDAVRYHEVGYFKASDAEDYLTRAGIDDATMRHALARFAEVERDRVHPFYLALCSDIVLAAQRQGTSLGPDDFARAPEVYRIGAEMVARLLQYVDRNTEYAVHALACCPVFDFDLFRYLGKMLSFDTQRATFDAITEFRFVWPVGGGNYRIHVLLQRLLEDLADEKTSPHPRQTHQLLEKYYEDLADERPDAEALLIYHANRVDPQRGCREWIRHFEETLDKADYEACRALLAVREDLVLKSDLVLARISELEGQFLERISRYAEAEAEYREAIEACDRVLELVPDDAVTHNSKGNALQRVADLRARLGRHEQAETTFADAIAEYDQALELVPDDIAVHSNKGNALHNLADLRARLGRHEQAEATYAAAIGELGLALELAPDDVAAHNNMGNVLRSLANLQAALGRHEQAEANFTDAIGEYDRTLELGPDDSGVYSNKGNTLRSLADLRAGLGQHEEAEATYANAIREFDRALELAPDNVAARNNKGNALQSLANLLAALSRHEEAEATYANAIREFDRALDLAPDDVLAHNNKGNALQRLADLRAGLGQHEEAEATYAAAIVELDLALALAPDDVGIHSNKGNVLQSLANLQAGLGRYEQAKATYAAAIGEYDRALDLAPNDVRAHNNKGNTLQHLANLQAGLGRHEQAEATYAAAIGEYDRALDLAPDDVLAHNNKGGALQGLANLQAALGRHEEAEATYAAAIGELDRALDLAPNDVGARNNKGNVLQSLADLRAGLGQHEEAEATYRESLLEYDQALAIVPNSLELRAARIRVLVIQGALRVELGQDVEALRHRLSCEVNEIRRLAPSAEVAEKLLRIVGIDLPGHLDPDQG